MIPIILFLAPALAMALFIFRSKKLNAVVICLYSFTHLACSVTLLVHPASYGRYFQVEPLNLFFLVVLSVVLAGISVYNADFTLKSEEHTSELQSRQYL